MYLHGQEDEPVFGGHVETVEAWVLEGEAVEVEEVLLHRPARCGGSVLVVDIHEQGVRPLGCHLQHPVHTPHLAVCHPNLCG